MCAFESSVEDSHLASECACAGLSHPEDCLADRLSSADVPRGGRLPKFASYPAHDVVPPDSKFLPIRKNMMPIAPAGPEGGCKAMRKPYQVWFPILLVCFATVAASAQSFRVQCPTSTITHPSSLNNNNSEPAYTGPTTLALNNNGFYAPTANVNGAIKCQQISGGDGYATMGDGTQTYMFSFGPLSGVANIAAGGPGTVIPSVFNTVYDPTKSPPLQPGDPATTV